MRLIYKVAWRVVRDGANPHSNRESALPALININHRPGPTLTVHYST